MLARSWLLPSTVSLTLLAAVACSSDDASAGGGSGGTGGGSAADGGAGAAGDGGPEVSLADALAGYTGAWAEQDEAARLGILEGGFAEDGVYDDPVEHAASRAELSTMIGTFQRQFAGASITELTGVDSFREHFRFRWEMKGADGARIMTGEDDGEVAPDGRIARISGFFDTSPKIEAPAAVAALLRALNARTPGDRTTELTSAVATEVVWSDRWMTAAGIPEIVDHLGTWLDPKPTTVWELGEVDSHSDLLRVDVSLTDGDMKVPGQVFGHLDADGRLDWLVLFDGELPPAP